MSNDGASIKLIFSKEKPLHQKTILRPFYQIIAFVEPSITASVRLSNLRWHIDFILFMPCEYSGGSLPA